MNKKVLTIVAIIVLLLLGGWFFMNSKKSMVDKDGSQASGSQSSSPSSLKDLITKGVAQSCTFSNTSGGNTSTGTIYVSSGKVRGDFSVNTKDGKEIKTHMIVVDKTSYIWTEGQKTGFKMNFDTTAQPTATNTPTAAGNSNGSFDANANMNYSCKAWVVDSTVFDLPDGVAFTAFSMPTSTTPSAEENGTKSQSSQCGYCNTLTGDDLAQCKKALNCN